MWNPGGENYDFVSFTISDALAHMIQILSPSPGEKILDIATGTGWSARNAALWGAHVSAVDIADQLLESAKALSSHIHPSIDFRLADAESLPFADNTFDGIVSTFGIMFARNQEKAAIEMSRVCKPGGRAVLAAWKPDEKEFVYQVKELINKYCDAFHQEPSPMEWGKPGHVHKLLGNNFDLQCEFRTSTVYYPDSRIHWDKFSNSFGPLIFTLKKLDSEQQLHLQQEFIALSDQHKNRLGIQIDRTYLLTFGIRK